MKTPDPKSLTELNLSADAVQVMKDIFENKIAFNRMIGLKIDAISATEANGHILMSEDLYGHYEHTLKAQEIEDLVAYLLTLP